MGEDVHQQEGVIAIVDDDPRIRDALDLLLSSYGYKTELFASPFQAEQLI